MKNEQGMSSISTEPYRVFFPVGVFSLLWGALIWIPLLWNPGDYPVLAHRYLMLNGFTGTFIAGFLMTAVPRFSETPKARLSEISLFLLVTIVGIIPAYLDGTNWVFFISSLQPLILLYFLLSRILIRKANPPYSFLFIFAGLALWFLSGLSSIFLDSESFKQLHYEGALASIILGVGSRLIPGIMGHVEIKQMVLPRERILPLLKTVPNHFFLMIVLFAGSYFMEELVGGIIRAVVVTVIAFFYWKLWKFPIVKTALSKCLWLTGWLILLSFVLKVFFMEGMIHVSHSFFISGVVLLSVLIATRVIQSHGVGNVTLENSKVLYVVTFLISFAAATRVSAYYIPNHYMSHLSYSSFTLVTAIVIWAWKYLRFIRSFPLKENQLR